jgi:hypothetical protein
MSRPKLSPEDRERIAAEKAAERKAAIRAIVDQAPPFSMQQIAVLSRIFEGAADRIRERAAQAGAES